MIWEEYHRNPAIKAEGYWADVNYSPPLLSENHPTKGFIAVDGFRIAAIGHVWFPEQQLPKTHYFQFDPDCRIANENPPGKIILSGSIGGIDPIHLDRLICLATDFRGKYGLFEESLDRCMKQLQQLNRRK